MQFEREDRRLTVREICETITDVSKSTVDKILTEIWGIIRSTPGRRPVEE